MRSNYNLIIIDYPLNLLSINDFFKNIMDFTTGFFVVSYPLELCAKKTYAFKQIVRESQSVFSIINNPSISDKFNRVKYEIISGSKVISEIPFIHNKSQKRLKIDHLNTDVIEVKDYLRNVFEDYLMA